MSEIQQTRWDRIIRRVSASVGTSSHVSETLSELFPVIDIERVPGELLLLGGTQICIGQTQTVPTAALIPLSSLRNPGGSGALMTITHIRMNSNATQIGQGGPSLNTLPTAGTQAIRDTRRGPTNVPTGRILSDLSLVAGPNFYKFMLNNTMDLVIEDPNGVAVLGPGSSFIVGGSVINTALRVGWMWRERPAEESELQF